MDTICESTGLKKPRTNRNAMSGRNTMREKIEKQNREREKGKATLAASKAKLYEDALQRATNDAAREANEEAASSSSKSLPPQSVAPPPPSAPEASPPGLDWDDPVNHNHPNHPAMYHPPPETLTPEPETALLHPALHSPPPATPILSFSALYASLNQKSAATSSLSSSTRSMHTITPPTPSVTLFDPNESNSEAFIAAQRAFGDFDKPAYEAERRRKKSEKQRVWRAGPRPQDRPKAEPSKERADAIAERCKAKRAQKMAARRARAQAEEEANLARTVEQYDGVVPPRAVVDVDAAAQIQREVTLARMEGREVVDLD